MNEYSIVLTCRLTEIITKRGFNKKDAESFAIASLKSKLPTGFNWIISADATKLNV